jgi:putative aminopeptidase FrvX
MSVNHQRILTDLLSLPTAPFAEHYVIDYVRSFCRQRPTLTFAQDKSGNVLISYGPRKRRPIVLAAHMDHPGFIADGMVSDRAPGESPSPPLNKGGLRAVDPGRRLIRAKWHGSVRPEYFAGALVRFFDGQRWVRGRIINTEYDTAGKAPRVSHVEVSVARPVPPGSIGMWDFPDPVMKGDRVVARGCDDVAGAAATLACLDDLVRQHPKASLLVLLTRAEEVGFVGAIAACRNRTIPRNAVVISIECSSELPGAKMGDGPILRVGDAATTFTPGATAYCRAVAERLAATAPPFPFQRKLMDGGTCEATAYAEFGYEATGLCIALGNYHNMDRARERLAPEYIDMGDWEHLVRWFVAMATTGLRYDGKPPGLRDRLRLERRYRRELRRSAPGGA